MKVFAALSTTEAPMLIMLDVSLRPLGIPYDDRRQFIVVVQTLESLTYALCRVSSVY